jgi:uncharacterized protein with ParB-like and HNH nuclease domain
MFISAKQSELGALLEGKSILTVPVYQRNYAWKSEQVEAFLNDIEDLAIRDDGEHFFGSIVVLDRQEQKELELIDGQQRITTTIMLLAVLRDLTNNLGVDGIVIGENVVNIPTKINSMLKLSDQVTDRYRANYKLEKVFKDFVLMGNEHPSRKTFKSHFKDLDSKQRLYATELRKAHGMIEDRVQKWFSEVREDKEATGKMLLEVVNRIRDNYVFLEVKMHSEDDAFVFFETLNDRGLRLTPSDLLKNVTLQKAKAENPNSLEEVLDEWDATVEKLLGVQFSKFLRHYLLTIQTSKVQTKNIFETFKKIIDEYGEGGAVKNLKLLRTSAELYSQVLPGGTTGHTTLDRISHRLNLFSETHRVLLLAVLRGGFSKQGVEYTFRVLDSLSFRWTLTGRNAQELETMYQVAANSLLPGDDSSLKIAFSTLVEAIPKDETVRQSIISEPARKDLQLFVMGRLEEGLAGHGNFWLANNPLHIEHLAPQKPSADSDWFSKVAKAKPGVGQTSYSEYVYKWGNLSLLEFEINTSIGNASWNKKLQGVAAIASEESSQGHKGLKNSHINLTNGLSTFSEWTHELIDQRTEWVAKEIVALTSPTSIGKPAQKVPVFKPNF